MLPTIIFKKIKSNNLQSTSFLLSKLSHKLATEPKEPKLSPDIVNYIESTPEYVNIKQKIPKHLLKKYKTPVSIYLINKTTAKEIVSSIKKDISSNSPVIEVNPGLGVLTEELLNYHKRKLYLYESSGWFSHSTQDLLKKYPGRIEYKIGDFFGMWKLAFQDKLDDGNRLKELIGELASEDNDRIVKIIGAMSNITFVKHLIKNIIFQDSINLLGRPDLFITMSVRDYEFLTDDQVKRCNPKTSLPAIFQLLFDYKVLTKIPKIHYLPWSTNTTKNVSVMDNYCLYLVNITRKERLPCRPDYLPLLWYFFKPQVQTSKRRIIPTLEQWIPGCGVRLITGQDPPDTDKELAPDDRNEPLPHMTIYTQFGDLNLSQKVTVFKRFISWPEFQHSPYRSTMENSLTKSITGIDDDKPQLNEDDIDNIEEVDGDIDIEHR